MFSSAACGIFGRHLRTGVPIRVDPDARHVPQSPPRQHSIALGGLEVLLVDDHEAVGQATGDPLGGHEERVRQRVPPSIEVEAVGGVDHGWT